MKLKTVRAVLAAAALLLPTTLGAQTTNPATIGMDPEVMAVVQNVQNKLKAGKTTEADLAGNLADFDRLLAKHTGKNNETAAQILHMEAMLYLQVLDNPDQAKTLIARLKTDHPETQPGKKAEQTLPMLEKQLEARKIQATLKPGVPFPDFTVRSMADQPLSVGALKGKVVLINFWTTWCGPCRSELPNVIATYTKHHSQGFEIIGVSLDSDREKLDAFLKKHPGMVWPQFYDGQGWNNELAAKYGVQSIPFTVLIGRDGKIIKTDLRGDALEKAVAKALAP